MKRILLSAVLLIVIAYLAAAVTVFNRKPEGQVCKEVKLVIKDSVYAGFVTREEVVGLLNKKGIDPLGKTLDLISTEDVEQALDGHPLMRRAECYKTLSGSLCIEVHQRIPILRVMPDKGKGYYIDNQGALMPLDARCVPHVVVATGNVDKDFARRELYPFGAFLQKDSFWSAQVEQIHVLADRRVELVPRVGNHIIYMGTLEDFERKLERLYTFYAKGLSRVGWNKYARISVEFDNQIICTKR